MNTVIGAIIGLVGVAIGFLLSIIWDVKKEKNRKQEEFTKIVHNVYVELLENSTILSGNIGHLKENFEPIIHLNDESWKPAKYSGLLRYISSKEVYVKLIVIYNNIRTCNLQLRFKENLQETEIEAIKEMNNQFIDSFTELKKYIDETIKELDKELKKPHKF